MEGVEDFIANGGEACTDNLGPLLMEDAYRFVQPEVLIDATY